MSNLRDKILSANDIETEDIYIKEWDVTIKIKTLSGYERNLFEKSVISEGKESSKLLEKLIIACAVDDNMEPIFTDADVDELARKSSLALTQLFLAAQKLNKMREQDIDLIEKN